MEQFCELTSGVTLCYETFGNPGDPPVLLVMGLGTQMLGWPDAFCSMLAERGLFVVRFDNRDTGRSSAMRGRPPSLTEMLVRRVPDPAYTLSDMAADAVGLLDGLGIETAHMVGASMGGMIAQTIAIEYPARTRSLVSIMSTTGDRGKGRPSFGVLRYLLRRAPTEREAFVEHMVGLFDAIGSSGLHRDRDRLRATAERVYERGLNPSGTGRQLGAIITAPDRTPALRRLAVPTLVIHGTQDPMVNVSGGRATARAVPGAELMLVEGMGHDLPDEAWPRLVAAIAGHAERAERSAAQLAG
jgi:pimeloyl-ACP methyl ester carboxylesterase